MFTKGRQSTTSSLRDLVVPKTLANFLDLSSSFMSKVQMLDASSNTSGTGGDG
jgi:hypothetical protein